MKPNFALNFTHESIGLLHRTARGWLAIGEVALDAPDLGEALSYLRRSALGLAPQGITTKLIIPNSQILYRDIAAPGPDREAQVRRALDGVTPYAVDDLAFAISGDAPVVQVAVIARETLEEAESFAVQHKFNPVAFVAMPPEGQFTGEPFFGVTALSATLLRPGESVERDTSAVQIARRDDPARRRRGDGAAPPVVPPEVTTEVAQPSPEATEAVAPEPASPEETAAAPVAAALTPDEQVQASETSEPVEPSDNPAPAPLDGEPSPPPVDIVPSAPEIAQPAVQEDELAGTEIVASDALPDADRSPDPLPDMPQREATALPDAAARAEDDQRPAPPTLPLVTLPPSTQPPVKRDGLSETRDAMAAAFASRRRDEGFGAAPPLRAPPGPDDRPPVQTEGPGRAGGDDTVPQAPAAAAETLTNAASPRREAPPLSVVSGALLREGEAGRRGLRAGNAALDREAALRPLPPRPVPVGTVPPPAVVPPKPALRPRVQGFVALAPGPQTQRPGARVTAKPMLVPPAADPAPLPALDPALAATMPGDKIARARPKGRRGSRYLGLILTLLLLAGMALVAVWSSRLVPDDRTGAATEDEPAVSAETSLPQAPTPLVPEAGPPAAPAPDLADTADAPSEAANPDAADPAAIDAAIAEAGAGPEAAADPEAADPEELADLAAIEAAPPETPAPEAAPQAEAAPAGAAPETTVADQSVALPDGPSRQDEIFLSAADVPPAAFDAAALPPPVARPDLPPAAAQPPPPPGTVYRFDGDGLLVAPAEGILAPGGYWLIAARPPVTPPARPAAATPPAAPAPATPAPAAPQSGATTGATAAPGDGAALQPAPAAPNPDAPLRRPLPRPAGLASAAEAAPVAVAAATAPTVRPRARATAGFARAAAATADGSGSPSLFAAGSPPTLQTTPRPAPRPSDLRRATPPASGADEAAVDAAVLAALAQPPAETAPPEAEPAAPRSEEEADGEPEVAAAARPIPSRASVAKQATYANAINLSQVNLIGIYGTPSKRYAMVRSANGRFSKVRVGDRVDGGTVAAITGSELRYQKSGRMLVLELPRG